MIGPRLRRRALLAAPLAMPALLGPHAVLAQATAPSPAAPPLIVGKQIFEAGSYRTRGGGIVPNVRIGYQTAGRLSAAGDNAVLITHFFSGNSHAFGRFAEDGPAGYWDAIIGPGKAIDTNRFFVISSDTLVNLSLNDAFTTSTGPATIDPSTGRPFGTNYPVVSMRDFVEVQKRLLDSLGVKRLALVAGPSGGALQAIEWACAYPGMVDRVMPAVGTGEFDAFLIGWMELWETPIKRDPNWRNGDYYGPGREPPLTGLAEALKIVTLQSRDRGAFARFGRRPVEGQDPARRIGDSFAVERFLDEAAMARAKTSDANAFLYLTRANQLFLSEYPDTATALSHSQARWLVVPAPGDHIFPIAYNRDLAEALRKAGRPVRVVELEGDLGHLEGVSSMAKADAEIRAFMET
ncbi:E22 family MetX-like putative esterase [Roseomonas xinghualingensis]|uniref:E22 family MetX-like putative esterase n=1 Tax=Roseomonas xinghualingensis TaxID=2986475 RepID=UPI0021F1E0EA|nr:homoserine O-acetyltransferase [Roseomonas sp. SXEYE001]MCV4207695.1 homoserine O-acetyltransferase [Roseomonas sp. SXEYE001]